MPGIALDGISAWDCIGWDHDLGLHWMDSWPGIALDGIRAWDLPTQTITKIDISDVRTSQSDQDVLCGDRLCKVT